MPRGFSALQRRDVPAGVEVELDQLPLIQRRADLEHGGVAPGMLASFPQKIRNFTKNASPFIFYPILLLSSFLLALPVAGIAALAAGLGVSGQFFLALTGAFTWGLNLIGMLAASLSREPSMPRREFMKEIIAIIISFGVGFGMLFLFKLPLEKQAAKAENDAALNSDTTDSLSEAASGLSINTELAIILTAVAAAGMLALFAYNKLSPGTASAYRPGQSTAGPEEGTQMQPVVPPRFSNSH